ncbi:MAG: Spy/CpxP family protein refolding chaperone [Massilia sp.]
MKTLSKFTVMGLILAASAAAMAQTPPAGGRQGGGMGGTPEQRQAMMAERQAKLHDALKLTPEQEGAWTTYTNAIKTAMASQDRAAMRPAREAADKALAAALTPEQNKILEAQRGQRGGPGGQGRPGGQGGQGMPPAGQ